MSINNKKGPIVLFAERSGIALYFRNADSERLSLSCSTCIQVNHKRRNPQQQWIMITILERCLQCTCLQGTGLLRQWMRHRQFHSFVRHRIRIHQLSRGLCLNLLAAILAWMLLTKPIPCNPPMQVMLHVPNVRGKIEHVGSVIRKVSKSGSGI